MIIDTIHTYTNVRRSDGKKFFHESKDRAELAAKEFRSDYSSVAEHTKRDVLRCDPCHSQGICAYANPAFHLNGQDHCQNCFKQLQRG